MKFSKKLISFIIGLFFVILGSALEIKAGIGTGAFNAFASSVSTLTAVQVGYICMGINVTCMLLQLTVKKQIFSFWIRQVFMLVFAGILLNFFVYTVMGSIVLPNYPTKLAILLCSPFVGAFGIVFILESDFIALPLESLCAMLAERFGRSTGFYRQIADVLFIVATILLTIIGKIDLNLREGTIIGALLFGPAINLWKNAVRRILGINNHQINS